MEPDRILLGHINLARGFRGGERQTELLLTELATLGIRQRLVARSDGALLNRNANCEGLECSAVSASLLRASTALADCTLVHAHDGRSIHAAALAGFRYRMPYLATRRVAKPIRSNRLTRRSYRGAATIVVVSAAVERHVIELKAGTPTVIIPDAWAPELPDANKVRKLRATLGSRRYIVGHVGALDRNKGQLDIIAAARQLPEFTFVLVGGGPDEEMIRTAGRDLDNLVFTGHVDDVANYLAAFDLFVFPSLHEGLGSVLLDAMRIGLPIVATRTGGIPEIIRHGTNGLLVAPGDAPGIVAALQEIAADADTMRNYSETNKSAADMYSPRAMARSYMELYRRILGAQRGDEQETL